jgi:threonylcarbamoyladenosine tRNA methylthiotransferase MtaB
MSNIIKRVAFYTLGCKLNFSETSTIGRSMDPDKFTRVDFEEKADIYIINTCSVTEAADKKCRQVIKKSIKKAPDAYIIVVGCYAQLKPEELTSIPGVDLVLGINERFDISSYIDRVESGFDNIIQSCDNPDSGGFSSSYSLGDRTRSFLKVQDGCDYPCSYCTIPKARGKSKNQSINDCVSDAEEIARYGVKEIVITGVNIGDFGKSTGEDFHSLLKELIKVKGIERYRISSIEPNLLTDEIISLVERESKIVPHFHIPLQSGSNRILGLMKRRYKREVFADRVKAIRKKMPDAAIGADVIVGFPGETDKDFNDTLKFLRPYDLSYLHAFSFSARPDTPAAGLPGQIKTEVKHLRSKSLQQLSENKKLEFYKKSTGKSYNVLWEKSQENGLIYGFTENYIRVVCRSESATQGKISSVRLKEIDENGNFTVTL